MKISSLQENFKTGLQNVSHLAGKNVNLPILNNILIDASNGNIKFISTNLEIGIISQVRGKIEQEGSFTVDAKIITDYINLLPNKKIELELKNNNLIIECDNYKTKIKTQPKDDYPIIPKIEENFKYSIDLEDFKKAINQVLFAVSTNETKIELAGVCFEFNKNDLILAATDSYRLAEKKIKIQNFSNKTEDIQKIIIPAQVLQELIRVISNKTDDVNDKNNNIIQIIISDNQVLFIVKEIKITSKLIEGQYPDYKQIIPTTPKTTIIINRNELIRAVKASSLFSKTGINDINLDFPKNKNKTIISSESGQTGESVIKLESIINGEDNGLIINYRYLLDGLNNIDDENVKLEIINNNTPCVLKGEKEKEWLYIIMPIKQ